MSTWPPPFLTKPKWGQSLYKVAFECLVFNLLYFYEMFLNTQSNIKPTEFCPKKPFWSLFEFLDLCNFMKYFPYFHSSSFPYFIVHTCNIFGASLIFIEDLFTSIIWSKTNKTFFFSPKTNYPTKTSSIWILKWRTQKSHMCMSYHLGQIRKLLLENSCRSIKTS